MWLKMRTLIENEVAVVSARASVLPEELLLNDGKI